MIEIEKENLISLSQNYTHICINIRMINDLNNLDIMEWNHNRETLLQGLYGKIYEANIWLGRHVYRGCIKISDLPIVNSKFDQNWSINLPLNDMLKINKMMKLKAFW